MFFRYFFRIGTALISIMLIAIGIICYKDSINPILLVFPGEVATDSYHIIPEAIELSDGLSEFDRIVVDGESEAVQRLYEQVSEEAQKLPSVFSDIVNDAGFKIVITDNISKYTRQQIPDGFILGGVKQEHGNDKRIVIFPVQGDRTSLYHEIGHVIVSAYEDMENKSLTGIWKHDREGAIALTGEYAGTDADECWAEAFRFMLQNKNNPIAMEKAERLMPVSYLCFQEFLKYDAEHKAA